MLRVVAAGPTAVYSTNAATLQGYQLYYSIANGLTGSYPDFSGCDYDEDYHMSDCYGGPFYHISLTEVGSSCVPPTNGTNCCAENSGTSYC